MKVILSVCLILLYNDAFITSQVLTRLLKHNPPPPVVTERTYSKISSGVFTQKLDHFDPDNTQTWSQKFFVTADYFNKSGDNVAFLMLGGEGAASEGWMKKALWVTNGIKYGAILFQLEHRFYGESQPTSDWTVENLRYLSSEQALADAAEFIKAMTIQFSLGPNVKWVSFGGSYSGSLSAWLRLKYPDLVHAAVASSGPLRAEVDYTEYFDVVVDDLKNTNEQCVVNLKKAMAQVDDLLVNPPDSEDETLTSIFNLCDPIEKYDLEHVNVNNFYMFLADTFAGVAQYNGLSNVTLEVLCDLLNDESNGSELHRLADMVTDSKTCTQYSYEADLEYLTNTTISGGMARQWYYQTCTEFGWYQTTKREDKVFGKGVGIDFFTTMCSDMYGPNFNSPFIYNQIDKTNDDYDGIGINETRIVFVHGSVDPWHAAGLLKANNPDSPVIYIEGTSHCNDMYDISEKDLPQLAEAKQEVGRLIGEWLKED